MARIISSSSIHRTRSGATVRTRPAVDVPSVVPGTAAYDAFRILRFAFTVLPIIAGVDKFVHALVDWDRYLAPVVARLLPIAPHTFMQIVGVIEILAGLIVAIRPRFGGYLVAIWLWGIIANLFLVPGYYDVAARDFGLSLGALALGRLGAEAQSTRLPVALEAYGTSRVS